MDVGAVATGLGGALFIAVGFVVQQHAAADEPDSERLSFVLLTRLARRPIWLAGIASMVVGQLLGAAALGQGSLALVEPIMATNVLFALPLAALWRRRRLGRREWIGAVCLVLGLAVFVVAGNPHGGHDNGLPWPDWVEAGGAIALIAAALVALSRRLPAYRQATVLAVAAGALYGFQDALTQRTEVGFSHGFLPTLESWPVFTLVAVAVVALLLNQSAFEAAPLAASLPSVTVTEPISGIAFGVGVYGEHLTFGGPALVFELLGVGCMIAGVVLIAASPVVTGVNA